MKLKYKGTTNQTLNNGQIYDADVSLEVEERKSYASNVTINKAFIVVVIDDIKQKYAWLHDFIRIWKIIEEKEKS